MTFSALFDPETKMYLANCRVEDNLLFAGLSWFEQNLNPGYYQLGNTLARCDRVCSIYIPDNLSRQENFLICEEIEFDIASFYK